MKFLLTILPFTFFWAINADMCPIDLLPINMRLGNYQANVIERTACNNLDCLRKIVDRADISLRADDQILENYIDQIKADLDNRAEEIENAGGNVSDCNSLRSKLDAIEIKTREAINCIVDKATSDSINDIDTTREIIEQKENYCRWINDALCCDDKECVKDVANDVKQGEKDALASIEENLREVSERVENRIAQTSADIIQQIVEARGEADNLKSKVEECLQLAEDNIPCDD